MAKRVNEAKNGNEKNDELFLDDDVKMVNHIRAHAKKHRMFKRYARIWMPTSPNFSCMLKCVGYHTGRYSIEYCHCQKNCVFFTEEANPMAVKCQNTFWLAKLLHGLSV